MKVKNQDGTTMFRVKADKPGPNVLFPILIELDAEFFGVDGVITEEEFADFSHEPLICMHIKDAENLIGALQAAVRKAKGKS